jgi:hypothetical protein
MLARPQVELVVQRITWFDNVGYAGLSRLKWDTPGVVRYVPKRSFGPPVQLPVSLEGRATSAPRQRFGVAALTIAWLRMPTVSDVVKQRVGKPAAL